MINEIKNKKSKEYHVYFDQINRKRITVKAKNEDEAQTKATERWKKEIFIPRVTDIEIYQ